MTRHTKVKTIFFQNTDLQIKCKEENLVFLMFVPCWTVPFPVIVNYIVTGDALISEKLVRFFQRGRHISEDFIYSFESAPTVEWSGKGMLFK